MANQETKKVLTIVDRSTKALNAAAAGVVDIVNQAQSAAQLLSTLATDVEFKQNELESLEGVYADKVRVLNADLEIQVKENKRKVLTGLLSEFGLAEITKTDLGELQKDFEYAQREVTKEINDAVAVAVDRANQTSDSNLKSALASHQVEIATYKAQAEAKDNQIGVLTSQVQDLRSQIDKDREAHVQIASSRHEPRNVAVSN